MKEAASPVVEFCTDAVTPKHPVSVPPKAKVPFVGAVLLQVNVTVWLVPIGLKATGPGFN
jgi:hypothetical protein